jgi:O-antigen/teichoic acid export membrane protein
VGAHGKKTMNKYLRAISANYIFFIVNAIFFLAITPIAIRVMGEEFYGLWAVLLATMIFLNIGNLGIGAIVVKFSSESSQQADSQVHSNRVITSGYILVFAMAGITAALLLFSRNFIADSLQTSWELREQFRQSVFWIALSIFPQFLARVPQGFLLSQLRNRTVRQIELFLSILLWLGAVILALVEKQLVLIAAWCFLCNVMAFGLSVLIVQKQLSFRFQPHSETLRKMLNFSGFMFLESLAITMFQQFDKVIVGFTLGPVFAGVYSVGTSLSLRLSMLTGQATEVMIPYASQKNSSGDHLSLYTTFRQLSRCVGLSLAFVGGFLIIWMYEILSLWIYPDYASRYANAFRILIVSYGLLSLSRPAHQTLTGLGKVKFTSLVYFLSTLLMLIGLYFLSRQFGFLGAAASNLILASLLVFNVYTYSIFQKPIHWRDVLADLQWGMFLLLLVYELSQFSGELTWKLALSGLLTIFLIFILIRDVFIKNYLFQFVQNIFKSRI